MKTKFGLLVLLACLLSFNFQASSQSVLFSDWKVLSENGSTTPLKDTTFLDTKCVKLDGTNIAAIWNKTDLKNFRMEFDMAGSIMAGVGFHVADEQNYQFLYFRPGYGNTREAIQYIPIYNGALSWVLYDEYQNTADIKDNQWFHVAIEVKDQNLKVFVNNSRTSQLDIDLLGTKAQSGSILLRTMFGPAYFANVKITELPLQLTQWEISEEFPKEKILEYPDLKKVRTWTTIRETGDDYVNFCRYFPFPKGIVFAKKNIVVEADKKARMDFDFAGKIRIFLNGMEIFRYEKANLEVLDKERNHILLDLKKGANELVLISEGDADFFGEGYNSLGRLQHQNWGFIGKLVK